MMQSPEAQYQLALKMPMDRLIGILQGRPDAVVGQPIAMMALKALKEQKTAFQGQQAQAQLQQPNVKDQLLAEDQGIATYPADNMGGFEESGIVGYADGGDVRKFSPGGDVARSYTGGASWFLDLPRTIRDPSTTHYREIPNPMYERLGEGRFPTRQAAMDAYNAVREGNVGVGPVSAFDRAYPSIPRPVSPPPASGYAGYAPPAPQQTTKPGLKQTAAPTSALIPDPNFITQLDAPPAQPQETVMDREDAGLGALARAQEQAQTPQANLETYEDVLRKSQVAGADYRTQITDLVKQMTASPEEKAKERETRLGTGLLSIASDLLEPGQTSSGARGKAFKTIAGLASQYSKEDKADKRANIGFELSTRMGIAQLEQGDRKNATDLFNHAQTLLVQQADMAGKRAMHLSEMNAKERGFSIEETKIRNEKAYHDAYIDVLRDGNKIKERLGVRGIAAEETRAAAVEQRERAANLRTYVDAIKAELAGTPTAARRKALQEQLDGLTRSIGSELGIAGATPRPIQIPDTAGGRGAKIHDLE
jgi:hypothetical protein